MIRFLIATAGRAAHRRPALFTGSIVTMSSTERTIARPTSPTRLARWALVAIGTVCVGLGALGIVVPGLPTTVFLIVATWCFTKSCPYLERLLIRNRLFAPFLRYVDRTEPIPARTKAMAIATMWSAVALAVVLFVLRDGVPSWLALPVACAACVGTVAIVRWDVGLRRSPATS